MKRPHRFRQIQSYTQHPNRDQSKSNVLPTLACEVARGIKPFAERELLDRFRRNVFILPNDDPEAIIFRYAGSLPALLQLRTVEAVYIVQHFAITRPRALLGHQNLQVLVEQIHAVEALYPEGTFTTFRISAAGSDSSTFNRIKDEIAVHTRLQAAENEADLLLRVLPSRRSADGWEVWIRISPRPLSARPWRVYNMPGALNASIAAAMIDLTNPTPNDRFLNVMCGSGTIVIERLLHSPAAQAIGCDTNPRALDGARQNLKMSKLNATARFLDMDATNLRFEPHSFDVICVDLPWGQLVGSHKQNVELYAKTLVEAARVAVPDARLVVLTHEIALFEQTMNELTEHWLIKEMIKIDQGGLHPRIYSLQRSRSGIM